MTLHQAKPAILVGESRVDWNTGRLKHSDFLENHASLSRQILSLSSASKTDQPREILCNDIIPFKCYPRKPVFDEASKIFCALVVL